MGEVIKSIMLPTGSSSSQEGENKKNQQQSASAESKSPKLTVPSDKKKKDLSFIPSQSEYQYRDPTIDINNIHYNQYDNHIPESDKWRNPSISHTSDDFENLIRGSSIQFYNPATSYGVFSNFGAFDFEYSGENSGNGIDPSNSSTSNSKKKNKKIMQIPIFPLPIVCFPGQKRDLHIFEMKYRTMMNDIMKDNGVKEGFYTGGNTFPFNMDP